MTEENENQSFKYSSGEHVLIRIHDLWKKLHFEVSMNNYYNWDVHLDRIWCELVNLMDDDEYDKLYKDYQTIQVQIKEVSPILNALVEGRDFFPVKKDEVNKIAKQYSLLMLKEQTIRKIQRKVEKKVIKTNTADWD